MKYFLLLFLFYSGGLLAQSSIYDLSVQSTKKESINLSMYKGKKVLISVVSPGNLVKKGAVRYWDSLQTANPEIGIMIIPADDINAPTDTASVKDSEITASDKITLTQKAMARKDKDGKQHPVIKWLTHVDQNTHFDTDVTSDQQIYVVSESGILYAVLENGVSAKTLDEILKQRDPALDAANISKTIEQ